MANTAMAYLFGFYIQKQLELRSHLNDVVHYLICA